MLGDWESLESAIERPSSLRHEGLLKHEGKVHFPYSGHLVEEDKRPLEQRIYFLVFSPVFRRIAATEMARSEFKVL